MQGMLVHYMTKTGGIKINYPFFRINSQSVKRVAPLVRTGPAIFTDIENPQTRHHIKAGLCYQSIFVSYKKFFNLWVKTFVLVAFIFKPPVFLIKRYTVTIAVLTGGFGVFIPVLILIINIILLFPVISNAVFILVEGNGNIIIAIFSFTFIPYAIYTNSCFQFSPGPIIM